MGDCSWGGVSFYVRESGELLRAAFPKRPLLARREAPWGTRVVTQVLNSSTLQLLTLTLEMAKADEATLRGLTATLGTLALTGGISYTNTMLDEITSSNIDDTNNVAFVVAVFTRAG